MAKLYFYYSAMNAGKTTTLLQSSYNYNERGMETVLYLPALDHRAGVGQIASRIGLNAQAIPFERDLDFLVDVRERLSQKSIQCILVDEAHFLTQGQVEQLSDIVDSLDIPVLTYGLRTDFLGEPFEGSKYLLALAENIIEIKTICHCGRKATMNVRINDKGEPIREGQQVEIGGNDRYVSVCRKHYKDNAGTSHIKPVQRAAEKKVSLEKAF